MTWEKEHLLTVTNMDTDMGTDMDMVTDMVVMDHEDMDMGITQMRLLKKSRELLVEY